ncbi:MAG: SGNH/GDSL hydrolase family protein [Planctomycetaceae bacterium]
MVSVGWGMNLSGPAAADDSAEVISTVAEPSGEVTFPERILFLGNSITLHGPAPQIGWTGNWGMAASRQEYDYVHRLLSKVMEQTGHRPQSMIRNIADFERTPTEFDIPKQLASEVAFRPDLIIIAIGENAARPETDAAKQKFAQDFRRLVSTLGQGTSAKIFVRSQFWPDPVRDGLMQQVTNELGHHFVDISAEVNESCYARSERAIEHAGVAAHPGDQGMQVIAEALWRSIQKSCCSEKSSR